MVNGRIEENRRSPRLRRAFARMSAAVVGVCLTAGAAVAQQPELRPRAGGESCLRAAEADGALGVALLSIAPVGICAPSYYVVELRNNTPAALGDARLSLRAPVGGDRLRFEPIRDGVEPTFFEISVDDGATWSPIDLPLGTGDVLAPLQWSQSEAQPLARLGPAGALDDSVLVRWRATLGQSFGAAYALDAQIDLAARAVDSCGRSASGRSPSALISARRPELHALMQGRNLSRGGDFGVVAHAAPGDEIEWRIAIENFGEASARQPRARVGGGGETRPQLSMPTAPDRFDVRTGVVRLEPIVQGGRQVVVLRERAAATCALQPRRVEPSWGCVEPAPGAPGAIVSLRGMGEAALNTAPDPNRIRIEQAVASPDGRVRPGDLAEIKVEIANYGAPVLAPQLVSNLPDGYALDISAPVTVRSSARLISGVDVVSQSEEAPVFRFTRAGGDAELGEGESVTLSFGARRVAEAVLTRDALSSRLAFFDGCGHRLESRAARFEIAPRQAALEATLTPVDAPIVAGAGDVQRFRVALRNTGDEVARDAGIELRLGDGWVDAAPARCEAASDRASAGRRGRFYCRLGRDLGIGGVATFDFDVIVAAAAEREDGVLSVEVQARSYGRRFDGEISDAVLARGAARSAALGFRLRQRLLDVDGRTRSLATPIDLGEQILAEFAAEWFGVGDQRLEDAAVVQTLPPQLGYVGLQALDADMNLVDALTPDQGRSGQILWSLESFEGDGRFVGRTLLEAVQPGVQGRFETADVAPPPPAETKASLDVNAVFRTNVASFGVDALSVGPTMARPLSLRFRRPTISMDFVLPDAAAFGDRSWLVRGGDRVVAEIRLSNRGGAPGFLEEVRLRAPRWLSLARLETDGVDNDADGAVDEDDETTAALLADDGGAGGVSLRWRSFAPDELLGTTFGAAQSLGDGATRVWRIALDVDPATPPDTRAEIELDGRFAAQPFASQFDGARIRLSRRPTLRTAAPGGFLVLSRTSFGGDLSRRVSHGETVDFRLTTRMPPGRVPDARIEVELPDALGSVRVAGLRVGPGVSCDGSDGGATLEAAGPNAQSAARRLIWRLGDCRAGLDSSDGARLLLLDFTGEARDADPEVAIEQRRAWRRPQVVASIRFAGADGAKQSVIGRTQLEITGPLIQAGFDPLDAEERRRDAGDAISRVLWLRNIGDASAYGLRARLERAPAGLDCAAIRFEIAGAGGEPGAGAAGGCGGESVFPDFELAPGRRAELTLRGGLNGEAALGRTIATPMRLKLGGAAEDRGYAARTSQLALEIDVPPPAPPVMEAATLTELGEPRPATGEALIAVGDAIRLAGDFAAPEGALAARLVLATRLLRVSDAPLAAGAPIVALTGARLVRNRADLEAMSNPGGVNAAAPGDAIDVAGATSLEVGADGWTAVALPLGAISVAAPGAGETRYRFEASLTVADVAEVSAGRRLEATARWEVVDSDRVTEQIAAAPVRLGRIAEPLIELAAVTDDADGVARPGEKVTFDGLACNRGDAPAYAVVLRGRAIDGLSPDPQSAPSFAYFDASALGRRHYGQAELAGGVLTGRPTAYGAELAPGACLALRAPMVARRPAAGAEARLRFELEHYQGRPSATAPGRVYKGPSIAEGVVDIHELVVTAPEFIEQLERADAVIPFTVTGPVLAKPAPLRLTLDANAPGETRIYRDRNRDGRIDGGDDLWIDGATLSPGETLHLLARLNAPQSVEPGWRVAGVLRALAVLEGGAVLSGAAPVSFRRAEERAGSMAADRSMAVDRDCDGDLADEATQDAVFEPSKQAAAGDCIVLRLSFHNLGGASVEGVVIEDDVPDGVRYVPGSARFAETPQGLLGGEVSTPDAVSPRLKFQFIGALSPGASGAVEYRVRLSEGF